MDHEKSVIKPSDKIICIPRKGKGESDVIITPTNKNELMYTIVDSLPTENISTGTIYVLKNPVDSDDENKYLEYAYINNRWEVIGGNIDASKIFMTTDIPLRGDWESIGSIKRSDGVLHSSGKSVASILKSIFYSACIPTISVAPSIQVTARASGAHEIGTTVTQECTIALNQGKYNCNGVDQSMNCSITSQRILYDGKLTDESAFTFVLPQNYSSKYTVYATIRTSTYATDDNENDTDVIYKASVNSTTINGAPYEYTHTMSTLALSSYRMGYFYGTANIAYDGSTITSQVIRSLNKSNCAYVAGTRSLKINPGSAQVIVAVLSGKPAPMVYNSTVNSSFDMTKLTTINVMAADLTVANSAAYDIYVYTPADPFSTENNATITIK